MKLTQECILLQNELRKFSQQVLADRVDELDKSCNFPMDNIKRLADMGIIGALIPESYGGASLDAVGFAVVLEEIARVCASTAFVVASHNVFFAYPILKSGSEEMKKKYLPAAASGKMVGAFALPRTNELDAEGEPERSAVSGKNPFVLNATAGGPVIAAFPAPGSCDPILYILDKDTPGCTFMGPTKTIGLKAASIGEYHFNKCTPPAGNVIGAKNTGRQTIESMFDCGRILLGAISVGIGQGACDSAIKYAKERIQFGQPITEFGMVREQIADMLVAIESARHMVYDAALRMDRGEDFRVAAAMAKLVAGRAATAATTAAIQVYGGYGYMKDYPAERYFRDAQMLNVICSTPDEDKEIIAKGNI